MGTEQTPKEEICLWKCFASKKNFENNLIVNEFLEEKQLIQTMWGAYISIDERKGGKEGPTYRGGALKFCTIPNL